MVYFAGILFLNEIYFVKLGDNHATIYKNYLSA
jgi:hypothetical protein